MSPAFLDAEHARLQFDLTSLENSPGRALGGQSEKNVLLQKIADNRWHARNPGLTGSWRLSFRGSVLDLLEDDTRFPRFETEAEAKAWIANDPQCQRCGEVKPAFLRSRYVIEGLIAPVARAA